MLKRWTRAVDGRWFGRVDFSVCDSYGAVQVRHDPADNAAIDDVLSAC